MTVEIAIPSFLIGVLIGVVILKIRRRYVGKDYEKSYRYHKNMSE